MPHVSVDFTLETPETYHLLKQNSDGLVKLGGGDDEMGVTDDALGTAGLTIYHRLHVNQVMLRRR